MSSFFPDWFILPYSCGFANNIFLGLLNFFSLLEQQSNTCVRDVSQVF